MTLPDRVDIAAPVRQQLMFETATVVVPALACPSRACRRHRRCLFWRDDLGEPDCLSLLSPEERAAFDTELAGAERAYRVIVAGWPPAPSPDPDVRERQNAAVAIAGRVVGLAERLRPGLRAWLRQREDRAPPLKHGEELELYRDFERFLAERRQFTDWSF